MPERDDLASRLELAQEEHLVDQLADLLDLQPRLLDERGLVGILEEGRLEQREQTRERRPQLVRDDRGEAGTELVIGREVVLRHAQEQFAAPVELVRDEHRGRPVSGADELLRHELADGKAFDAIPRAAAGENDVLALVQDDQDLAAFLDEDAAHARHPAARRRLSDVHTLAPEQVLYHLFTSFQPPGHPLRRWARSIMTLSMGKVLIVEDDAVIAQGMVHHLRAAGFDPLWIARGELGLTRLRYERPDVCVLDLMLPELDGWNVIERAREEGIGTPIIVVSARGTEHDRIHALELGADDYLVKPFSMKELVARVRAAARRGVRAQEPARGEPIEIEELRIDPANVQAYVNGQSADLTPTEFRLLYALALEQGRVVTRDELLQKVWGRRETHRDRTVDVCVRKLRQKIDQRAIDHTFIQTRFGVGYKLDPVAKAAP